MYEGQAQGSGDPDWGAFWHVQQRDIAALSIDGSYFDCFGLYPLAQTAQLLPQIEIGEAAYLGLDNGKPFVPYDAPQYDVEIMPAPPETRVSRGWGLWHADDPSGFTDAESADPIVGTTVPSTSRESLGYFDPFNCVRDSFDVEGNGGSVERTYELCRAYVSDGHLMVLQDIATNPSFMVNALAPVTFRSNGPFEIGAVVNSNPCPWPFAYAPGGGLDETYDINVEYRLVAQGLPSSVGGQRTPPVVFAGTQRAIPRGISLGPGRWSDERYGFGVSRYGGAQWLQRGPYLVRFFATVTITNTAGADRTTFAITLLGRLSGFVQAQGAHERALYHAITRVN